MSKSTIFSIVAIFGAVVLVVGVYFVVNKYTGGSLYDQKIALEKNLNDAKDKLNRAKKVLENMTTSLKNYFSFSVSIQDQMNEAMNIVKQTNFLFANPDSVNPEFLVKDASGAPSINNERQQINLLLADWEEKTDILFLGKIDQKEAEKIRQEAETIKTYLQNLYELVGGLTPENSGLTQLQINIYLEQLPSLDSIDEVLDYFTIILENPNNTNTNSQNENPNSQTDETNSSDDGENQDNSDSTPPVTIEDVIAQQKLVAEAEEEVQEIEEEITEVKTQIEETAPPSPTPVIDPEETDPIISPTGPDNKNYYFEDTINVSGRKIVPSTGIIIQPGPARLIQGSDEF